MMLLPVKFLYAVLDDSIFGEKAMSTLIRQRYQWHA